MSRSKKKEIKSLSLKKETYLQLTTQLANSLSWLQELIGEKKFETRIKKAAKLLTDGVKGKAPKKIKEVKQKTSKKKTEAAKPIVEK